MLRKFLFLITIIAFQACTNQKPQKEKTQSVNKPLQINGDSTDVDGKAEKL